MVALLQFVAAEKHWLHLGRFAVMSRLVETCVQHTYILRVPIKESPGSRQNTNILFATHED